MEGEEFDQKMQEIVKLKVLQRIDEAEQNILGDDIMEVDKLEFVNKLFDVVNEIKVDIFSLETTIANKFA